jgi:hypothetical protein
MQNKANLRKGQMNISVFAIKDYENKTGFGGPENKAKQSQFQNAIWFKMGKNERASILGIVDTCLTGRNKSLAKSPNGGYKEHLVI